MACYNSLLDPHLSAFFASTRVRRHLRKAGLVSSLSSVGFVYATCTFMIIRVITSTWLSIWVDIKSLLGARHSVATHTHFLWAACPSVCHTLVYWVETNKLRIMRFSRSGSAGSLVFWEQISYGRSQ